MTEAITNHITDEVIGDGDVHLTYYRQPEQLSFVWAFGDILVSHGGYGEPVFDTIQWDPFFENYDISEMWDSFKDTCDAYEMHPKVVTHKESVKAASHYYRIQTVEGTVLVEDWFNDTASGREYLNPYHGGPMLESQVTPELEAAVEEAINGYHDTE